MICLSATFHVKPGAEDRAADCFRKLSEHSKSEAGCLSYQYHRSATDPRKFFVYEQYVDEAALQAHSDSTHYAHFVHRDLHPLVEASELEKYIPL